MSALLAAPCALQAQTDGTRLADNSIVIENKKVEQTDHSLVVDLTLSWTRSTCARTRGWCSHPWYAQKTDKSG